MVEVAAIFQLIQIVGIEDDFMSDGEAAVVNANRSDVQPKRDSSCNYRMTRVVRCCVELYLLTGFAN